MKEERIIIVVAVCLIAVFSSFMYVYSHTLQRSADDLVKINANAPDSLQKEFERCVKWTTPNSVQDCQKIKDLANPPK